MSGQPLLGGGAVNRVVGLVADRFGLAVVGDGCAVRVKSTPTHHIDVFPTTFNWRLITVPLDSPYTYDRGWCYTGRGCLERALLEAWAWPHDDGCGHVPYGWYKTAHAGGPEIRQPEFLYK